MDLDCNRNKQTGASKVRRSTVWRSMTIFLGVRLVVQKGLGKFVPRTIAVSALSLALEEVKVD